MEMGNIGMLTPGPRSPSQVCGPDGVLASPSYLRRKKMTLQDIIHHLSSPSKDMREKLNIKRLDFKVEEKKVAIVVYEKNEEVVVRETKSPPILWDTRVWHLGD
jgi:hypothetical protein